ncbi:MAG: DUF11 domain-containing protein, partial [Bacteroidetes bacterium]|nr:DUF11 domain-containing protein [Bacteroidota bacterium]
MPNLTLTNSNPASVIVNVEGESFSVETTVTNTATDPLASFEYCVADNPSASLNSVVVGGNTLSLSASSPAGQTCYTVSSSAINAATGTPELSDESLTVTENWTFDDCDSPVALERLVSYDCGMASTCATPTLSTPLSVEEPLLTLTNSNPASISAQYAGFTFDVSTTVTNTTGVDVTSFRYCVDDNPNLTLNSVTVDGNPLSPSASSPAGQSCFDVAATDINNATGSPELNNESMEVSENWTLNVCGTGTNLERQVNYECCAATGCSTENLITAVNINVPDPVLDIAISPVVPQEISKCGPGVPYTFTVTYTGPDTDLTNLVGTINLPTGLVQENLTPISGGAVSYTGNPNEINLPNLQPTAPDNEVVFSLDLRASCGFTGATGDFNFSITHDPFCENSEDSEISSDIGFFVQEADLSIPSSTPNSIEPFLGDVQSINTTVANGGNGVLEEATYCVSTLSYATLNDVIVGGVSLSPAASSPPGFQCYTIGSASFMNLFGTPFMPTDVTFNVEEVWAFTGCPNPADPILRRVQYGCFGETDCQMKPQGEFPATAVNFGVAIPDVDVSISSLNRPACYADELTPVAITLTNNGNAPAQDLIVRISAGGGALELADYAVSNGTGGMHTDQTIETVNTDAGHCTMGVRSVVDTIKGINLAPGSSITVDYAISHSCSCNDCSLRDIYRSDFRLLSVTDFCGVNRTSNASANTGNFDAFMNGFVEAPLDLESGSKATVEYSITSTEIDWFNEDYPDAYLESVFTMECGLDYQSGSISWTDRDGTVWPSCDVEYVDGGLGADDMLRVRWCKADRPVGFTIAPGMEFTLCVIGDCTEKDLSAACDNPVYDATIAQNTFFTIDPTCTNCPTEKIFAPEDIDIRLFCPNPMGCPPCEGLVYESLDIVRTTLGQGDADNDQVPDGPADPNLIRLNQFIQGDTLQATLAGTVSDPGSATWQYGFATLDFPNINYTPLGVNVEIVDADGGTYSCGVVPVTRDDANSRLVIDFSVDTLIALGCSAIPSTFDFDEGDQIEIELDFQVKDVFNGMVREVIYDTDFYVSDAPFGSGTEFTCNDRRARLYQVGVSTNSGRSLNGFGACETSSFRFRYDRHIGSRAFDEFPYEIRTLGIPKTFEFQKPAEFSYRLDQFGVRLEQEIPPANNIVNLPNGSIPSTFLTESGDQLVFQAEDYFESFMDPEIQPDEGYRAVFFVPIQGNCASIPADYDISYALTESVNESVYCTDMIDRPEEMGTFTYTGAAELVVNTLSPNLRVCSGSDTVRIRVDNIAVPDADNAYIYINSPTGGVVVQEVRDLQTNTAVAGNNFGIFPIGSVAGGSSRTYEVIVKVNNCAPETLDFVAGWDCEGLPATVEEAICSDPSTIMFNNAMAGMNIDVEQPLGSQIVPLCEPVVYEVEIRSTDLGFLRDIELSFILPPGLDYTEGTLELANPSVNSPAFNGYSSIPDPVLNNGIYSVDVSAQDPALFNEGLIGTKDLTLTQNKVSLRFEAETTCDFLSGSRTRFFLNGNNNCGDPLPTVFKRSGRVRTTTAPPEFMADIVLGDLTANPCNNETVTSFVNLSLSTGNTSVLDSVRYLLPPGLAYAPGSYTPILNAPAGPPQVRTELGQQILVWPADQLVNPGDQISFSIDLLAEDIGQACVDYDLVVQAFSRRNELCDGTTCSIAVLAGEGTGVLTVEKPDLTIDNLDANLSLVSTSETLSIINAEVCNNGATLQSGQTVNLEIYEDTDRNGFRSAPDVLLFTISSTLAEPLEFGECITLSGDEIFPSGTVCTIIGVVNPNTTCTCNEIPSFQVEPEVEIVFPMNVDVCSREPVQIGPDAFAGYDFEWISINGSDLGALSATNTTPVTFMAPNTSGSTQTIQYALRSSTMGCYEFDTVTVTLYPETADIADITACENQPYPLPSPNNTGTNFTWMPSTGLSFPGPDSSFAVIDAVLPGLTTYTVTYDIGTGCNASYTYNVTGADCGTSTAALGDTVWFDFDQNGVQDPLEPGIEGGVVNLFNAVNGNPIASTTTDANGFYNFGSLVQGNYFVEFVPLDGFVGTLADAGGDDTLDSDADAATGQTGSYFLPWDTYNPTIDAGFIPDCELEVLANISDCMPSGDTLARTLNITVNWSGNPYTYDQFFGDDTIRLSYLGIQEDIVIDSVNGSLSFSRVLDASNSAGGVITADFVRNPNCGDTAPLPAFEPCLFDLALAKTINSTSVIEYGGTVCFDIELTNQGEQAASDIRVNDYLPMGFSFLPGLNPDWADVGGGRYVTVVPDTLSPGESIVIPLKVQLEMAPGADSWTNFAEIAAFQDTLGNDVSDFDIDSTPDDIVDNDAGGQAGTNADNSVIGNGTGTPGSSDPGTDEDDHDPASVEIFDLALVKEIISPGPYAFGQQVTFRITVENQGNVTAENISVRDYIPDGYLFNAAANPDWTAVMGDAQRTIAGPLPPGGSTNVDIVLTLQDAAADQFVNIAEITRAEDENGNPRFDDIDSTPDTTPNNDAGGAPDTPSDNTLNGDGTGTPGDAVAATDEDDHDPAFVTIPSIALLKSVVGSVPASSGTPGNFDVTYQLEIENDGNEKLLNLQLTDNLVAQLGAAFVTVVNTPAITASTATQNPSLNSNYNGGTFDNMFTGTDGELDPDQAITVQLTIEIDSDTGLDPIANEATTNGTDDNGNTVDDTDEAVVELPDCFLDVVCPSPVNNDIKCLADLPAAATNVAQFNAIDQVSAIVNACGMVTISSTDSDNGGSGCSADPLVITRTYTISDPGDGMTTPESETCTVTYTIVDDERPKVSCPDPVVTACEAADVPILTTLSDFIAGGGTAHDNCGISNFTLASEVSDNGTCPETVTRTYQVEDACGNQASCTQTITVNDTEKPVVTCIPLENECLGTNVPPYANLADFLADGNVADDNCGVDPNSFTLVSEDTLLFGCPLVIERLYQVSDLCGNVSCCGTQLISYTDDEAPQFNMPAPSDVTLSCSDPVPPAVTLTATDNCDADVDVVFTEREVQTGIGSCEAYSYQIIRNWVAADDCGNRAVEEQVITVVDNTPPTAVCCPDFTVSIGDEVDGIVTLDASSLNCGSTDDCTPDEELEYSISPNNFTAADLGPQAVTLTVTDVCGNSSSCTVDVTVTENPQIGLAKRAISAINQGDGTYHVIYELKVRNFGDVALTNVQVVDNLQDVFGASCDFSAIVTADQFTENLNYGQSGDWNLLAGTDELAAGQQASIWIEVEVSNCSSLGTFANTAVASGESPGGGIVTDNSVDGTDADPTNDGDPGNDDSPTNVTLGESPVIGSAKRVVEVINNSDGSYTVTYEFNIENFGDVVLSNVQLTDDLGMVFTPCNLTVNSISSSLFTVNTNFGQAGDWNMLTGTDVLTAHSQGNVLLTITVGNCGTLGTYNNQVTVSADSPTGQTVTDASVNGSDPDPLGDGVPEEFSDTPVTFDADPVIGVAKRLLADPVNNGDGTYTVSFEFRVANSGNVALNDIELIDDLNAVLGTDCAFEVLSLSSEEFTVNTAYDGATVTNLLNANNDLDAWDEGSVVLNILVGPCTTLGSYSNTATVNATTPFGMMLSDVSQDGSEPDPDGVLGPGNNSETTDFELNENAELGAAKRVTNITNNGDGTYTVGFEVKLENSGDVDLSGVQAAEDLAATFAAAQAWTVQSLTSEEFTVNTDFDGDADINLLSGTDQLLAGNEGAIYIEVLLTPGSMLTGYENSVTASGASPSGDAITDVSTDGAEPDADGDGSPADDMAITPVDLTETPSAGIAKRVANITNNGDGSYTVLFEFNIENYGDVAVSNLQVTDDLAAAFPGTCEVTVDALTSDDYTVNASYDGVGNTNLLAGTDVLPVGDKGAILLEVTVGNCGNLGPFANTATLGGSSPSGAGVTDESVNGSSPDPNQDGSPGEMSDTPISFEEVAMLGLAKQVAAGPVNNGDGTYTLTFEFRLENTGNIDLSGVQLQDDLDAVFGANCAYTIDGLSSSAFTVNPAYDGSADINLLSGTDELKAWNSGAVYLTVTAGPCDMLGTFANSAEASGTTPTGNTVTDISQEGPEPDPDGNGPGDNSEPSEFDFDQMPSLGVAKREVQTELLPDGSANVTFEFNLENFGNVNLS